VRMFSVAALWYRLHMGFWQIVRRPRRPRARFCSFKPAASYLLFGGAAGLFLSAGCIDRNQPVASQASPATTSVATVDRPQPTVEILNWDQVAKRREQFRGKVVVLDVWSTYCDPCVREFPHLVELQQRFGDKVRCISFDTDYSGAVKEPPESFRKPVLEFLSLQHADGLLNLISSVPNEDFYNQIHLGGPPAVFVYDQAGKLIKRFDNSQTPKTPEFTYARDVVPLVEKLVRAKP
jgi:thiol-disulfide isomerase/thioredoxin